MRIRHIIEISDPPVLKLRNMGDRNDSPAKKMIDELHSEYKVNPLNDREILIPIYGGLVAVILTFHTSRTVHIEYYRTEPRKSGLGQAGLELLKEKARKFDVELTANVDTRSQTPEYAIRKMFRIAGFVEPSNQHVDFIWRPER